MGSVSNEKVAIITGGTSGIGLALARHLHDKGWRVALVGRRPEIGQLQATSLDPSGTTAIFERCNVSSYAEQAAMFKNVWAKWARIDLLIANAGNVDGGSWYNFRRGGIDDVPPEPDTSCTDTHLKGVMYGTMLATHYMRHNRVAGGKIIATTSMHGVHPCPTFPEYGSAEAGVNHWVRVTAPLLKSKENIFINAILMGAVITPVMPGFAKAFKPEHLVLPATILKGYDMFIDGERTGETVELAHDKLFWYEVPELKGGECSVRAKLVYEPWFSMVHGEKSGLVDALQEAPEGNAEDAGRVDEFAVGML
ncbi:hypothetical protein GE09DRAFT_1163016 [Coniochaeta sp. 2T2.1]|nr:hypothetical protein GE09DRAFT_1163016 [Coniochaeta sp. 2T2.1]